MVYNRENKEKALNYLINNEPFNFEKFKKLYDMDKDCGYKIKIPLDEIVVNKKWNASQKIKLLKLYEYEEEIKNPSYGYYSKEKDHNYCAIDYCIVNNDYDGFSALLALGAPISDYTIYYLTKNISNPKLRYKFCRKLLKVYENKENFKEQTLDHNRVDYINVETICDVQKYYTCEAFRDPEIWMVDKPIKYLCETNDIELVKLFLPFLKDIDSSLMYAVETGNIEMVKLFLDYGANINYQPNLYCRANKYLPALKVAIENNDLEMVKFLHKNGADLNFYETNASVEKRINETKENYDKHVDETEYLTWINKPFEYALNVGTVSLDDKVRFDEKYSYSKIIKSLKDRIEIVKYMYENGAKFNNGEIDYNKLIIFAIKSDSFDMTRYFFEEVDKNNYKLDYNMIIKQLRVPGTYKTYNAVGSYDYFENGAVEWFDIIEENARKLSSNEYLEIIQALLEKIFNSNFCNTKREFDIYLPTIKKLTNILPKKNVKKIAGVFGVPIECITTLKDLGYDINCINQKQENLLMANYYKYIEDVNRCIELGVNPNYVNKDGASCLSYALRPLEVRDFSSYIDSGASRVQNNYEKIDYYIKKSLDKLISIADENVINSSDLKAMFLLKFRTIYARAVYMEQIKKLGNKGLKIDDETMQKYVGSVNATYVKGNVDEWKYLSDLYSIFDNSCVGSNISFPNIERLKEQDLTKAERKSLLDLIKLHINRCFVTKEEQIENPTQEKYVEYNSETGKDESVTVLFDSIDTLLGEIYGYLGYLNWDEIIELIDSFPILKNYKEKHSGLLIYALKNQEIDFAKALINKGYSLEYKDKDGHDVTRQNLCDDVVYNLYVKLNPNYNPDVEFKDLLSELDSKAEDISKKMNASS